MPRTARFTLEDRPAVYHVMSHTALDGFPFGDVEKEFFLTCLTRFSSFYFAEVLGFCIMGNHFHLLVRMFPSSTMHDDDVAARLRRRYGDDVAITPATLKHYRQKWSSLSEFMRELKQTFSRYYNKKHQRRGYLWAERFKSVLVEDGRTLINCLAYIDLNPIRAALVARPEEYRWSSIGYHFQTGNRGNLLSCDFGMAEWDEDDLTARLRNYRQFLYEAGTLDSAKGKTLDNAIVEEARSHDFVYTRTERFLSRTRWFTDSSIIGSKAFVAACIRKLPLPAQRQRNPQKIDGLDMYSLKRLSESS
ncbi:transposase [Desulfovibrio inopinatus]|uniref:transposase n=1 Tax=Desulfovibrio inopinatus TaxID=102109 RepID=UPI0003F98FA5|nr:transposase [Desulfovibrio inopinatus]